MFIRKNHIIETVDSDGTPTGETQVFTRKVGEAELPAINAAKRKSRELQKSGQKYFVKASA